MARRRRARRRGAARLGAAIERAGAGTPQRIPAPAEGRIASRPRAGDRKNLAGRYIRYGVREHEMAPAMNGIAARHFMPYGGTFLTLTIMRGRRSGSRL